MCVGVTGEVCIGVAGKECVGVTGKECVGVTRKSAACRLQCCFGVTGERYVLGSIMSGVTGEICVRE